MFRVIVLITLLTPMWHHKTVLSSWVRWCELGFKECRYNRCLSYESTSIKSVLCLGMWARWYLENCITSIFTYLSSSNHWSNHFQLGMVDDAIDIIAMCSYQLCAVLFSSHSLSAFSHFCCLSQSTYSDLCSVVLQLMHCHSKHSIG